MSNPGAVSFKQSRAAELLKMAKQHRANHVAQARSGTPMAVDAGGFIGETPEQLLARHTSQGGAVLNVVETMISEEGMEVDVDETGASATGDSNDNFVLGSVSHVIVNGPKLGKVGGPSRGSRVFSSCNKQGLYELDEKDSALLPKDKYPVGDELRYSHTIVTVTGGNFLFDPEGKLIPPLGFRFGTAGRFMCLDNIPKGNSVNNRQSDSLVARRVRLQGSLSTESFRVSGGKDVAGDPRERTNMVRLMLVYDTDVKGVPPNASDILEGFPFEALPGRGPYDIVSRQLFGGGPHPLSFAQRRNKRFIVLADTLKVCNRGGDSTYPPDARASGHPNDASLEFSFDVNIPDGLPLSYVKNSRSGLPYAKEEGAFYLFAIGNGRVHNTLMGNAEVDSDTQGVSGRGWHLLYFSFEVAFSETF